MKKNDFKPFTHNELELKNALLSEARKLSGSEEFSNRLASAVIFASLVEYLAEHLLKNLSHLVYKITYLEYAGIIYIDERSGNEKLTLGQLARHLEKYSFPDKKEIIEILEEIARLRNHLFHNLAKTSVNDFAKLDKDIKGIQDLAEQFIEKINIVTLGLTKILLPQEGKANDTK